MNRLTERTEGGYAWVISQRPSCGGGAGNYISYEHAAVEKLAEYEDTGLSPEEIEKILDRYGRGLTLRDSVGERLRALSEIPDELLPKIAAAYREDRLRILPCPVGSTLYEPGRGQISEYRIKAFSVTGENVWIEWELTEGIVLQSISGVNILEIGKTVFLTKEEAEEALNKKQ